MLDNLLPRSQTLSKLASERIGKSLQVKFFFFLQTLYFFLLFYHCPLSEGTNRFESKLFTPLIKTPRYGDNVRRELHALDKHNYHVNDKADET